MKYGVYCGSFAPVHRGHVTFMHEIIRENLVDKIIVVPTGDYWDKKVPVSLEKRLKCLKIYETDRILIDEDKEDCLLPRTYLLLERLQEKIPDGEFYLILGADNLLHLDRWVKASFLIENYPFIIMNRDHIDAEKEVRRLEMKRFRILSCEEFPVSSSYIREHLNEPSLLEGLIDRKVLEILNS